MTINKFEDLEIWQLARTLCKDIYLTTDTREFKSDIRFCSQIRAAAGSIMDNIAEGFEREGKKEFTQFLFISKGSCAEVKSQLYRALDIEYISKEKFDFLSEQTQKLGLKITNMILYLKKSDIEGRKYKE